MTARQAVFVIALLLACAWPRARANACSLGEGALLPTNYELVRAADVIVLARSSFEGKPAADPEEGVSFRFTIVDVLRGSFPERSLVLFGLPRFAGASPENDFSSARRGAFAGGCVAYDYRGDHLYVLFLDRDEKGIWELDRVPFSRVNEEVASPDSPWVKAVRAYSRVADQGDYERQKRTLRELAKTGGQAIARDLEVHFRTPTVAKSEADLLALYREATTDRARSPVLWALSQQGGSETATLFHGLLAANELAPELAGPTIAWAERQHAEREFANIVRHAARRARDQHWPFLSAIAALGGAGDLPAVEALLPELTDAELTSLGKHAPWLGGSAKAVADLRRRIGGRTREAWELVLTLAAWGDKATLERGLADLGAEGDLRWVEPYIVARSTRPEVPEALERILATGNPELVAWFVEGLHESVREDRLALLTTVLAKRPVPPEVIGAARKALIVMRVQGVAGAQALAATLPPGPAEDEED